MARSKTLENKRKGSVGHDVHYYQPNCACARRVHAPARRWRRVARVETPVRALMKYGVGVSVTQLDTERPQRGNAHRLL